MATIHNLRVASCGGLALVRRSLDAWSRPLAEASSYLPKVNRESKDKGKGKDESEKVDKKTHQKLLLTHRCDGAILSDRRGDGLSAVRTQAVCRYIELLTKEGHRKHGKDKSEK